MAITAKGLNTLLGKAKPFAVGIIAGLLVGIIGTIVAFTYNPPDAEPQHDVDAHILFGEIAQISELATAAETYTVVEKVEKSNDKLFNLVDIPFTDNFFILSYKGTIKAGINLEEAKVTAEGERVVVKLPAATILSDAIDTSSFAVLHEQTSVFSPVHVEDVTKYIDKTRQEAEAASIGGKMMEEARSNAETAIRALLEPSLPEGYTVEFAELPSGDAAN